MKGSAQDGKVAGRLLIFGEQYVQQTDEELTKKRRKQRKTTSF